MHICVYDVSSVVYDGGWTVKGGRVIAVGLRLLAAPPPPLQRMYRFFCVESVRIMIRNEQLSSYYSKKIY